MVDDLEGVPIGAVTRMTGITAHTLRKWESRYGVIEPIRTDTGRRLYGQQDIERLLLVRDLIDRGHPISSLADLSGAQLEALLARSQPTPRATPSAGKAARVMVIGHIIGATVRLGAPLFAHSVQLDVQSTDALRWLEDSDRSGVRADVVVLECATLPRASVRRICDLAQQRRVVVVYGFTASTVLQTLRGAAVICLRAPVSASALAASIDLAAEPVRADLDRTPPPARFSPETIARVAGVAPSIRCECPQHVAQLLLDLSAFEQYSLECIDTQPQDRILHAYLKDVAATARSLFEDALERVAIAEGIDLE